MDTLTNFFNKHEYHLYLYRPKTFWNCVTVYSEDGNMTNGILRITVDEVQEALDTEDIIFTTQICTLHTELITKYGYRIFIHVQPDDVFEITLGDCDRTDREIRPAHNLEKMLLTGAFDIHGVLGL